MKDVDVACFRNNVRVRHAAVHDLAADCPHLERHDEPEKTAILENAGMLLPSSSSTVVKTPLAPYHVGGEIRVICMTATFSFGAWITTDPELHAGCLHKHQCVSPLGSTNIFLAV